MRGLAYLITLLAIFTQVGCAANKPPSSPENLCSIFNQRQSWYEDAKTAEKKWGTPVQVMMAIMYQESSYVHNARPPRPWILFIPLKRRSSAYGYAQAQDATWDLYLRETGGWFKNRDNFGDAIDFIGWYTWKTRKINGISLWHADKLYLNYHEGWTGYRRGSYKSKEWLVTTAKRVNQRASRYGAQLRRCNIS